MGLTGNSGERIAWSYPKEHFDEFINTVASALMEAGGQKLRETAMSGWFIEKQLRGARVYSLKLLRKRFW